MTGVMKQGDYVVIQEWMISELGLKGNELLIYAYIKQLSNVKDDTKISGEEKAEKVKELEEKIAALESEISTES